MQNQNQDDSNEASTPYSYINALLALTFKSLTPGGETGCRITYTGIDAQGYSKRRSQPIQHQRSNRSRSLFPTQPTHHTRW